MLYSFQMLMDPMGGIVMTNDGNAILREVRILKCVWGWGGACAGVRACVCVCVLVGFHTGFHSGGVSCGGTCALHIYFE